MSAEIQALAVNFPTAVPEDDFGYLIGVLTGGKKIERLPAAKAAYNIVGYLLGKFLGSATTESVAKPKKVSKKQIAEALTALKVANGEVASVKAFPAWLIPVLLDLASKWVANKS